MPSFRRDPEVVIRRAILAVWAAVIIVASGFGFVACLVGMIHQGHPILILGMVGCLLGAVGGLYIGSLVTRPSSRAL